MLAVFAVGTAAEPNGSWVVEHIEVPPPYKVHNTSSWRETTISRCGRYGDYTWNIILMLFLLNIAVISDRVNDIRHSHDQMSAHAHTYHTHKHTHIHACTHIYTHAYMHAQYLKCNVIPFVVTYRYPFYIDILVTEMLSFYVVLITGGCVCRTVLMFL